VSETSNALGKQLAQFLLTIIFLPFEAHISLDAIVRTLVRVFWTKQLMLEWKTASDAERGACASLPGFCRSMWVGPALSATAGAMARNRLAAIMMPTPKRTPPANAKTLIAITSIGEKPATVRAVNP
jgi:hypothetical protein